MAFMEWNGKVINTHYIIEVAIGDYGQTRHDYGHVRREKGELIRLYQKQDYDKFKDALKAATQLTDLQLDHSDTKKRKAKK